MISGRLIASSLQRLGMLRRKPALAVRDLAVDHFLQDLTSIAPRAGGGAYAFLNDDKTCRGWVQFIVRSDRLLEIHRLWTLKPGRGNGAKMLRALCELADRHGIELTLKPLPFGRKPHPMTREQLHTWYQQHGFVAGKKNLVRKPGKPAEIPGS